MSKSYQTIYYTTWDFFRFLVLGLLKKIFKIVKRELFIIGTKNNLSSGFLLISKARIPFDKRRIYSFTFLEYLNHQRFFGPKIGWKKNLKRPFSDDNSSITFSKSSLLTWARSMDNNARWLRQFWTRVILRFVFGLRKTLNECSAEE